MIPDVSDTARGRGRSLIVVAILGASSAPSPLYVVYADQWNLGVPSATAAWTGTDHRDDRLCCLRGRVAGFLARGRRSPTSWAGRLGQPPMIPRSDVRRLSRRIIAYLVCGARGQAVRSRMEGKETLEELLALERAGWDSVCGGTGTSSTAG